MTDESPSPAEQDISFENVALVVRRPTDLWPLMAGTLGGRYVSRGVGQGYGWTQLRFANGFVLEGIYPELDDAPGSAPSDFVEKFLARKGVGPHHLTFRVGDLQGLLERLRSAGYHPKAESYEDPQWHEAFLGPAEAHGTVVQLVEVGPNPPAPA
ncbi:MAG: VOC family protein, partial [Microthrixaceae bacterium]